MLAQYYNSDSESDDDESNSNSNPSTITKIADSINEDSQSNPPPFEIAETPIPPGLLCPPTELRNIIDKTATYVLKNGKEFEDILRTKNDQRFTFLQYTDPYYKYYTFKVTGVFCPNPPIVIPTVPTAVEVAIQEAKIRSKSITNSSNRSATTLKALSMFNNLMTKTSSLNRFFFLLLFSACVLFHKTKR